MLKKTIALLSASLILTITGCQTANEIQYLPVQDTFVNQQQTSTFSRSVSRTDWYDNLSPDLKEYYASARGKVGEDLFNELHNIISKNNSVEDYSTSKSFMYSNVDNNGSGILTAYSQIFVRGRGGNGNAYKESSDENKDGVSSDFINCEHTWPQSFFSKRLPMVADLHHLQSTLATPNNRRGHYPLGEGSGTVLYTTSSGSKLTASDRTGRRNSQEIKRIFSQVSSQENGLDLQNLDAVFEPTNANKGNTARALLYFYLRYYDQGIKQGQYDEQRFWDSNVPTYLKWSTQVDPVDDLEKRRNEIIHKKQGNRNPFIDAPELALLIGERVFQNK